MPRLRTRRKSWPENASLPETKTDGSASGAPAAADLVLSDGRYRRDGRWYLGKRFAKKPTDAEIARG